MTYEEACDWENERFERFAEEYCTVDEFQAAVDWICENSEEWRFSPDEEF